MKLKTNINFNNVSRTVELAAGVSFMFYVTFRLGRLIVALADELTVLHQIELIASVELT